MNELHGGPSTVAASRGVQIAKHFEIFFWGKHETNFDIRIPPAVGTLESEGAHAAIHHRYPLLWLDRCEVVEIEAESSILIYNSISLGFRKYR